jgi:CRP/FNR family transcriptional regulator
MAFDATPTTNAYGNRSSGNDCLGDRFSDLIRGSIACSVATVAPGQHLFRAGDPVSCVYVLRSGALKGYLTTPEGEEQIVAFYSTGDVIGLESVAGGRHSRHCVSLSAVEVCRIPVDALLEACGRDRALHAALLDGMGREIQRLQSMLRLERLTADQRVASFLLSQARRQARGSGIEARCIVQLAMTRGEIGRFLDLATETVSRCLTRLQAAGAIRIYRNEIELLSAGALQRLVQSPATETRRLAA